VNGCNAQAAAAAEAEGRHIIHMEVASPAPARPKGGQRRAWTAAMEQNALGYSRRTLGLPAPAQADSRKNVRRVGTM